MPDPSQSNADDQTHTTPSGTSLSSRKWMDALPVAVYTTDADGHVTHANPAAVELSGREPELGTDRWCVTRKLFRADGTPIRQEESPMAVALKDGRSIRGVEVIAEKPDGERVWCEAYPTPLRNDDGEIVGGINMLLDISARKRQEEETARKAEALTDLFENATVGIHNVASDGTVLQVNQAELDLLGYSRDEYVGRHIADFHADQHAIEDILQRLNGGEELNEYEAALRCKDGSIRHALISSNVLWENGDFVHTRCFTTDVTDRKRGQMLVREQKRLLEMIASGAAIDECLESLCAAVPELSPGVRASILLSDEKRTDAPRSIAPDLPASFRRALEDAPPGTLAPGTCGEAVTRGMAVACPDVANDGKWSESWVRLCLDSGVSASHSAPIPDEDGDPMGSFSLCLDEPRELDDWERRISDLGTRIASIALERDRTLREVEAARAEAEEASRAKSEFLATMSHELRTPLNAIIGYADLLDAGLDRPLTEGQETHVGRIEASARHLIQLIEEILTFSRIEVGSEDLQIETTDVAELVRSTGALLKPLAEDKDLTLETRIPAGLGRIETDPRKVRQILLNLLSNALKFTEDGTIRVEALENDGDGLLLRVSDTGIGIAPDHRDHVFEPFSQVDELVGGRPSGTGLGLTVTRQLARLLGGDVELDSTLGEGSTFTVRLPRNGAGDEGSREGTAETAGG